MPQLMYTSKLKVDLEFEYTPLLDMPHLVPYKNAFTQTAFPQVFTTMSHLYE